jgi:hypothetical protein
MEVQRGENPDKVKSTLKEFRKAIVNDKQAFAIFIKNNKIKLDWTSEEGYDGDRKGKEVLPFLENNTEELKWLFIGSF